MNLSEEVLAVFCNQGAEAGYRAVCAERIKRAEKALRAVPPTDVVQIACFQEQIRTWEDVMEIERKVREYAAQLRP